MKDLIRFEYGAMSSKYSLLADNKLIAYATMICHYNTANHLVALYEPNEIVKCLSCMGSGLAKDQTWW